jgi:hypothetical protein
MFPFAMVQRAESPVIEVRDVNHTQDLAILDRVYRDYSTDFTTRMIYLRAMANSTEVYDMRHCYMTVMAESTFDDKDDIRIAGRPMILHRLFDKDNAQIAELTYISNDQKLEIAWITPHYLERYDREIHESVHRNIVQEFRTKQLRDGGDAPDGPGSPDSAEARVNMLLSGLGGIKEEDLTGCSSSFYSVYDTIKGLKKALESHAENLVNSRLAGPNKQ